METKDTLYKRLGDYDANRRTMLTALVAGAFAAPSARAQRARGGELRRESLSGPFAGYEARWLELVRPPGAASMVHKHP